MPTLAEFNRLSRPAQLLTTWEHGYYLAARADAKTGLVKLYQVGALFVEIHFRNSSDFDMLRAFQDPAYLQPYLDQVDLTALLGH